MAGNVDEGSGKKKFESTNMPGHRFLIPAKAAGAMIGKGGEVIRRLRSEHNCRIIVPDSQGPERLVIIDANPNTVLDMWNGILPSIKEYMNAKECDYKGSSSKYIDGDNEIDLRLIVHESQAGAVIGKGGERIRTLIDENHMTMIKLYKTFCPNSTDRVVRMVSKQENVMACLENVFELLENQAIKGARKDYNPDNFDETDAPNYGGYVSKDSRFPPRRIGNTYQPVENFYETSDYMVHGNAYGQINSYQYDDGMSNAMMATPVYNQRNRLLERGVSEVLGGTIRMSAMSDPNHLHVSRVTIPHNLVPAIIGKDGRRLGDLERECGASIEMEMDRRNNIINNTTNETNFLLSGTPDQIYKAQCLMQLCARKFTGEDGF